MMKLPLVFYGLALGLLSTCYSLTAIGSDAPYPPSKFEPRGQR